MKQSRFYETDIKKQRMTLWSDWSIQNKFVLSSVQSNLS